jgi:hydroxypyruvate reductase/glycerate 2-kinase
MTQSSPVPKDRLVDIFRAALEAVDPYRAVARHADEILSRYGKGGFRRLYVLAFGKAASPMVRAVADRMGHAVTGGVAITKYGHQVEAGKSLRIDVHEAGHPLPDENGLKATAEVMRLAGTFDAHTFALCLISGGGSALLVAPYGAVSLREKQEATDLLLKAGAEIHELNAVRKHASKVKGGRLAEIAFPATIESLILSDVIGDRLDVIASGPTAPDGTTYDDAVKVIEKYGLTRQVAPSILHLLREGAAGRAPETPKAGSPVFLRVTNRVVGNNGSALEAARRRAAELGFDAAVVSGEVRGEAREMGRRLAEAAVAAGGAGPGGAGKARCLISGGETTVTVKGHGLGGRNMELALAFAIEVEGTEGIALLSAGTDGTDGPTDAAGAIVDGQTAAKARARGIEPEKYLAHNDSYHFFKEAGGLFRTGPTGTNVMDVQVMLVE